MPRFELGWVRFSERPQREAIARESRDGAFHKAVKSAADRDACPQYGDLRYIRRMAEQRCPGAYVLAGASCAALNGLAADPSGRTAVECPI